MQRRPKAAVGVLRGLSHPSGGLTGYKGRGPAASSAGDSAGDVRSLGSLLGVAVVVSVTVVVGGG